MIKFFRNIRPKLLQSGKIKSYAAYAIGEIFLVVIGILMALQINTWNENKVKKENLDVYLQNLIVSIENDTLTMSQLEKFHAFRYYSLQYLLEQTHNLPFDSEKDRMTPSPFEINDIWKGPIPQEYDSTFVLLAFLWSHRMANQNLNTSVVDELKSIGMFSQIESIEMKQSINDYYSLWNQGIGEANQQKNNELRELWESSLGEAGYVTAEVGTLKDPLSLLRNNKRRIYIAKRLIREARWMMHMSKRIKTNAKELIVKIKGYKK